MPVPDHVWTQCPRYGPVNPVNPVELAAASSRSLVCRPPSGRGTWGCTGPGRSALTLCVADRFPLPSRYESRARSFWTRQRSGVDFTVLQTVGWVTDWKLSLVRVLYAQYLPPAMAPQLLLPDYSRTFPDADGTVRGTSRRRPSTHERVHALSGELRDVTWNPGGNHISVIGDGRRHSPWCPTANAANAALIRTQQ
ncbi:hypothetical protein AURDEDRAFT_175074 [Auricularia subglabra TFB-10046 SS5]|nr:hypothetical protein AURDEDRAFT_175074 [Auricularia subglabra TFB-10046 SS5]